MKNVQILRKSTACKQ